MRVLAPILICLLAFASACASGDPPQSNTGDAESSTDTDTDTDIQVPEADADAGGLPDAEPDTGPSFEPPQFYHSTSGGGLSSSPEFKLQMNFGAPMPRGTSSNGEYRLRFGPVSP